MSSTASELHGLILARASTGASAAALAASPAAKQEAVVSAAAPSPAVPAPGPASSKDVHKAWKCVQSEATVNEKLADYLKKLHLHEAELLDDLEADELMEIMNMLEGVPKRGFKKAMCLA